VRPAISAAVRICEPSGRWGGVNGEAPASEPGADHRGLAGLVGAADSARVATAGGSEPAGVDGAAGMVAAGGGGGAGVGATPLSDVDDVPGVTRGALAGLVDPVPAPDSGLVPVVAGADWVLGLRTPRPCSVEAAVPAVS
jgi:hypothetical protein